MLLQCVYQYTSQKAVFFFSWDIISNDLIRLLVRVLHEFMFSSLLDKQLGLELLVL